jgi:hypothetical protein
MSSQIKKLGAIERKKDNRDILLGRIQLPTPFPETYIPEITNIPTYYQNGFPTCGANAGTWLKSAQEARDGGIKKFSPRFLWSKIKEIDGYSLEEGTDMRSIFKRLKDTGVADYDLCPDNYTISLDEYTKTDNLSENAQPKIIKSYAFLDDMTFDGIRRAIYLNKEVLLLMYVDEGFFGTNEPIFKEKKWGHFVVGYGYDEKYIYIKDSTEVDYSKSNKKIGVEYISFFREGGTAVDLPDYVVINLTKQKSILFFIIDLLKNFLSKWSA